MMLADVNVLIGAYRPDSPLHPQSKPWFDGMIAGKDPFAVSKLAMAAVVRITSNPRSFKPASIVDDALGFCNDILGQAHCVVVEPAEQHWAIFERLCKQAGISDNDVTDAWYAALAIEHSCTFITLDQGFTRFPGLDWRRPDA